MPAAHRHGDLRTCGATTTVIGQSTVFVDGILWAVDGDTNTHGNGQLIPSGSTVYIEGKLVIVHTPDSAEQDDLCPVPGGEHCNPKTAEGSATAGGGDPIDLASSSGKLASSDSFASASSSYSAGTWSTVSGY